MNKPSTKTAVAACLVMLPVLAWAQFGQPSPVGFEALDVDGNQKIDRDEAREEPRLSSSFSTFDSDGDGTISKREFARFLGPRPPRPLF